MNTHHMQQDMGLHPGVVHCRPCCWPVALPAVHCTLMSLQEPDQMPARQQYLMLARENILAYSRAPEGYKAVHQVSMLCTGWFCDLASSYKCSQSLAPGNGNVTEPEGGSRFASLSIRNSPSYKHQTQVSYDTKPIKSDNICPIPSESRRTASTLSRQREYEARRRRIRHCA